jgi:hypothetical protein
VQAIKRAKKLTRHVPEAHREPLKTLASVPYALTKGQAADLLDVLYGGARWARPIMERTKKYPNQVQWDAGAVSVPAPEHDTALAAGRGGRKAAPKVET